MRRFLAVELSFVLLLGLCACGGIKAESSDSWQEQYDLGIRYLSEGNYEEAIIAFTAAIKIDPKRPEGYKKLAEAYVAVGDEESAREILEKGVAATGDEDLQSLLEAPQNNWVERPAYTGQPGDGLAELLDDPAISIDEVCIDGIPIRQLTVEQVQQMRPETEEPIFGIRSNSTEYSYGNWMWYDGEKPSVFDVKQRFDASCLTQVNYESWMWDGKEIVLDVGFRGLRTGADLTDVLMTLGFTSEGALLLAEAVGSRPPEEGLRIVLDIPDRDAYLDVAGSGSDLTDFCSIYIFLEDGWAIAMDFMQGQRLSTFWASQDKGE